MLSQGFEKKSFPFLISLLLLLFLNPGPVRSRALNVPVFKNDLESDNKPVMKWARSDSAPSALLTISSHNSLCCVERIQ